MSKLLLLGILALVLIGALGLSTRKSQTQVAGVSLKTESNRLDQEDLDSLDSGLNDIDSDSSDF